MAKRKDSVALFEVITATKRKEQATAAAAGSSARSVLRTPKWWFKNKDKRGPQTAPDDGGYAAPALPPAQSVPQLAAPVESSGYTAPQPVVQRVVSPERVTIPERAQGGDPFGLDAPAADAAPARARRSWLRFGARKLAIDPERREVTLRFRYTTAIIVGFAICVVVGLAYVTGRQTNRASADPKRISSEEIRRGPILEKVLDIRPVPGATEIEDTLPPPGDGAAIKPPLKPVASKPVKPVTTGGDVEIGLPRHYGLNYVIVQSYADKKTATEAQQALLAAGIECTVERGPKDWTADPNWYSVVGVHGFPARMKNNPAYQDYIKSIEAAGKKFAGKSNFKRFEPMAYKWKP